MVKVQFISQNLSFIIIIFTTLILSSLYFICFNSYPSSISISIAHQLFTAGFMHEVGDWPLKPGSLKHSKIN